MTMTGIEICRLLAQIRKETCEMNGIPFEEAPCPHTNPTCNGTCPVCDNHTRQLHQRLDDIKRCGGVVRYPKKYE